MKLGDRLLKLGYINKKQLTSALTKQTQEKMLYNKDLQLGRILIDEKYLTLDELTEALSLSIEEKAKEEKVMPTEIGEGSKFTFDLKFLVTMGAIIVSGAGIYFTMSGAIDELKSNNSPNRIEYDMLQNEITGIQNAGNLDIITYKLEEYDETFKDLKNLTITLTPLASDLEYLKSELQALKNKKIDIPEVDLSSLETKINNISNKVDGLSATINDYKSKLEILEKAIGGRF